MKIVYFLISLFISINALGRVTPVPTIDTIADFGEGDYIQDSILSTSRFTIVNFINGDDYTTGVYDNDKNKIASTITTKSGPNILKVLEFADGSFSLLVAVPNSATTKHCYNFEVNKTCTFDIWPFNTDGERLTGAFKFKQNLTSVSDIYESNYYNTKFHLTLSGDQTKYFSVSTYDTHACRIKTLDLQGNLTEETILNIPCPLYTNYIHIDGDHLFYTDVLKGQLDIYDMNTGKIKFKNYFINALPPNPDITTPSPSMIGNFEVSFISRDPNFPERYLFLARSVYCDLAIISADTKTQTSELFKVPPPSWSSNTVPGTWSRCPGVTATLTKDSDLQLIRTYDVGITTHKAPGFEISIFTRAKTQPGELWHPVPATTKFTKKIGWDANNWAKPFGEHKIFLFHETQAFVFDLQADDWLGDYYFSNLSEMHSMPLLLSTDETNLNFVVLRLTKVDDFNNLTPAIKPRVKLQGDHVRY